MKLIMETWRRYLTESQITKLRIFDFDETIAFTKSSVRVTTPKGKKIEFPSQLEYDNWIKKMGEELDIQDFDPVGAMVRMGYEFDYSDFDKVIDPEENNRIVKILGRVVGANRDDPQREVYIMTARGPESKKPIMDYLMTLKREDGSPRFEPSDFTGIITLAGQSKQRAIERIILKHSMDGQTTIKQISFFDDSQKNLDDVIQLRDKYPDINIAVEKVEHGDITSLEEKL
tara:strand:+ start:7061 stop:7750 length:690 start_codon:yes stop_codon:yes gene_type:complete